MPAASRRWLPGGIIWSSRPPPTSVAAWMRFGFAPWANHWADVPSWADSTSEGIVSEKYDQRVIDATYESAVAGGADSGNNRPSSPPGPPPSGVDRASGLGSVVPGPPPVV